MVVKPSPHVGFLFPQAQYQIQSNSTPKNISLSAYFIFNMHLDMPFVQLVTIIL